MKKFKLSPIKIFCLATGLAVGLVLLAKMDFEKSYDIFYPDYEDSSFKLVPIKEDTRPCVLFYSSEPCSNLIVRVSDPSAETILQSPPSDPTRKLNNIAIFVGNEN